MTHVDPHNEGPHYDIRGTAVESRADDVIVHLRDDHVEVIVNMHDPRLLEGLDSHVFTHLLNMLGIVDIAHLSEVSRATHAVTMRVPVAQSQQQRWTQLQRQWAANHQQTIAPLQSELAELHRAAFCNRMCYSIPLCLAFLGLISIAVGSWAATRTNCDPAECNRSAYFGAAYICISFGSALTIGNIICYCNNREDMDENRDGFYRNEELVSTKIEAAQAKFIRYKQVGLPAMRQEPMPDRFIELMQRVPVPESEPADAVPSFDASSSSSSSSSSSWSSSAAGSSSERVRPPPLSREQQRQNMALIVTRHQIWRALTQQGGYQIPFSPDVAYPHDGSGATESTDSRINALFSDARARNIVAEALRLAPEVPEPSASWSLSALLQPLSNVTAAVNWAFGWSANSSEPESKQPSQSVASSASTVSSVSGRSARTDLETRRKLIVELLQTQGFDAEYEVGRAYPGDGTGVVPLDADTLSYGPLFSDTEAVATIGTYVTQTGAQHQPELPVATSVEHARQLQEQGYEVKFHAPEDAGDLS